MGRRGQGKGRHTLATAVALMGIVPFAAAQVADGGRNLQLTVGQTLTYSDNIDLVVDPPDSTFRASTRLGLRYSDVTRTQRLQFSLNGALEANSPGDNELADPTAALSYALEGSNARLSFEARYLQTDLDDFTIPFRLLLPDVELSEELINDVARIETGIRTDTDYRLDAEVGLRGPVGLRLTLLSEDRRYDELQVFDLSDNRNRRAELETTFRIDPALTLRLEARVRRFNLANEEQSERDESTFGVGLAADMAQGRTLDVFLGQQELVITEDNIPREARGLRLETSLRQEMRNGEILIEFLSYPTLSGRDNRLELRRDMALQRGGTLFYGIGASHVSNLGTEPLFNLGYVQPLPRGRLSLELTQTPRTDDTNDVPVILSTLSANYGLALSRTLNLSVRASLNDVDARRSFDEDRRSLDLRSDLSGQINAISSWSLGASVGDIRVTDDGATTREQRYGVQMSYRRELTRDWDMVASYQHSAITSSDEPDRSSNIISFGLERTFDTRF